MMMQLQFFPSIPISFYMARLFLVRTAAVLVMLVLILSALDLLGQSGTILAQPGNGEAEVWRYLSLRVPQIVAQFLPFSVLLGTLITFVQLNQNSEIVAMKAAGLSAHQILAPMIVASLMIAAVSFLFNNEVAAPSTRQLTLWQEADFGALPPDENVAHDVWTRAGGNLYRADRVIGQGAATRLEGITIYLREDGAITRKIFADSATYGPDGWRLRNAVEFDLATASERRVSSLIIGRELTPDRFQIERIDPNALGLWDLGEKIDKLRLEGRQTAELEANWWHKISGPLSSVLMPLLGAVAAFGLARSGQLFVRAVIGMALGFTYFVADNFALAMGGLGAYPPLVAAWGPFFLFFLIGETVLVRTEE